MSKHINVNPDHYKVGGRERTGGSLTKTPTKKTDDTARARWERATRKRKRIGGR